MQYAICNETFEGWDHEQVCRCVARHGYQGLEMAPFTLAPLITQVTAQRRRELRGQAEAHGLQIIGLHWLLAKTEGFQLTASDETTRQRTAEYLLELARCCHDLGGHLMVFGSPAQRRLPFKVSRAEAMDFAADTFRRCIEPIAELGVKICMEPLSPPEADFVNTAAEGVQLIEMVNHPMFVLHLDVKAMATEDQPTPDVIRKYGRWMHHFHANDPNKRGPGFGQTDFAPIFRALKDVGYQGWVSVEVFDYSPDPETIARESIRYMKSTATANE